LKIILYEEDIMIAMGLSIVKAPPRIFKGDTRIFLKKNSENPLPAGVRMQPRERRIYVYRNFT
jgi:hypothetical protein